MLVPLPMKASREQALEPRTTSGAFCSSDGVDGFRIAGIDVRDRFGRISCSRALARFDLAHLPDLLVRGDRARTGRCGDFHGQYRSQAPVGNVHA